VLPVIVDVVALSALGSGGPVPGSRPLSPDSSNTEFSMAHASSRIARLNSLLIDDMRDMRANLRNPLTQLGMEGVDQRQPL